MKAVIKNKSIKDLTQFEKESFFGLLKSHYVDPTSLLEREFKKNNQVLICTIDNKLVGFFMTGWEKEVELLGVRRTLIFLGLSCTDYSLKGMNVGKMLYTQFVIDNGIYNQTEGSKSIFWFTTASPLVLNAARKYFNIHAPGELGEFSEADGEVFTFIKNKFNLSLYQDKVSPFILRNVAYNTRYINEHAEYINGIQKNLKTGLFDQFTFSEADGDRFLFYASNHTGARFEELKKEFDSVKSRLESFLYSNQLSD